MRGDLEYDIDGAVIKIDQIKYREDFPEGSKYSSGHIAYKYPPEERVVVMDEILVDVGRTGKLTFTGVFHDKEQRRRKTLWNQCYQSIFAQYGLYKKYAYRNRRLIQTLQEW